MNISVKPRILIVSGEPMTTSVAIAGHFEKIHRNVVRDIQSVIVQQDDLTFTNKHFVRSEYIDAKGRTYPMYRMTELGFSLVAMGFTGAKAAKWKRVYAETFIAMRTAITKRASALAQEAPQQVTVTVTEKIYLPDLLRMSTAELALRLAYLISPNEAALLWILIQAGAAEDVVHVSLQSLLLLVSPQMRNVTTIRAARKRLLDRGLLVMSPSKEQDDVGEQNKVRPTGAKGYRLDQVKVSALVAENELKWLQPFREEHGGRDLPGVMGVHGFKGRYTNPLDFLAPKSGEDIFHRLMRLEKESPEEPFITSEPLKAFLKERLKIEAGESTDVNMITYSNHIH